MKKIFQVLITLSFLTSFINAGNIKTSIRIIISSSDKQIEFINDNFDYVMTPFLNTEIRNAITKPKLFLYRSIQGTWENFNQFDWEHINSQENMFCHSDSSDQSPNTRILTLWNSWLMNGDDLVDKTSVDAINHWINYYAVTASTQVNFFNYDGLFIDSAGHRLGEGAVNGIMPWNYSADRWRDSRYAALDFIKSYLSNKTVVFNGLHSGNGADSSLSLTDGSMWEDFTFDINDGSYKGEKKWWTAIDCLNKYKQNSLLILVVKKPNLTNDISARIFSTASYLLVSSPNVSLSLSDWTYPKQLQYYPEYDIDLGNPVDEFIMQSDSLFVRNFEHGIVLVNPHSKNTRSYNLSDDYYSIVPKEGGLIDAEGNYDGYLTFEKVNGTIEIPPVSAFILKDSPTTDVRIENTIGNNFELKQNYPNPFNPTTIVEYSLSKQNNVTFEIFNLLGEKIKTVVNKVQSAGKHRVALNMSSYPSGVYMYQLRSGNFIKCGKMTLLK